MEIPATLWCIYVLAICRHGFLLGSCFAIRSDLAYREARRRETTHRYIAWKSRGEGRGREDRKPSEFDKHQALVRRSSTKSWLMWCTYTLRVPLCTSKNEGQTEEEGKAETRPRREGRELQGRKRRERETKTVLLSFDKEGYQKKKQIPQYKLVLSSFSRRCTN